MARRINQIEKMLLLFLIDLLFSSVKSSPPFYFMVVENRNGGSLHSDHPLLFVFSRVEIPELTSHLLVDDLI